MTSFWNNMSGREQRLLAVTFLMIAVGMAYLLGMRAIRSVSALDKRIDQLEQELINLTEQHVSSTAVEKAFRRVATERSSHWTEQEIHDRLRREIYRLALISPPAPGRESELSTISQRDYLVSIPVLREGVLNDDGAGYLEYQIPIRISPPTSLENILTFVERIQRSPQYLRIDGIEITRGVIDTVVSASLIITRTVVDRPPNDEEFTEIKVYQENYLENASFEYWNAVEETFETWEISGTDAKRVNDFASDGQWCLEATLESGEGFVYQNVELVVGEPYVLSLDLRSEGNVAISIQDENGPIFADQAATIPSGGEFSHYTIEFVLPGEAGSVRTVRAPFIRLSGEGTHLYLDNATLAQASE